MFPQARTATLEAGELRREATLVSPRTARSGCFKRAVRQVTPGSQAARAPSATPLPARAPLLVLVQVLVLVMVLVWVLVRFSEESPTSTQKRSEKSASHEGGRPRGSGGLPAEDLDEGRRKRRNREVSLKPSQIGEGFSRTEASWRALRCGEERDPDRARPDAGCGIGSPP